MIITASRCSTNCWLRSLNVSAPNAKRPKAVEVIPPRDPDINRATRVTNAAPSSAMPFLPVTSMKVAILNRMDPPTDANSCR